jgi:hypothetical protein
MRPSRRFRFAHRYADQRREEWLDSTDVAGLALVQTA